MVASLVLVVMVVVCEHERNIMTLFDSLSLNSITLPDTHCKNDSFAIIQSMHSIRISVEDCVARIDHDKIWTNYYGISTSCL